MTEYKNIKVDPGTFRALEEDKPDGVSWSYYLGELQRKAKNRT